VGIDEAVRTSKVQLQANNKNFQYCHQQQNKSLTIPFTPKTCLT